MESSRFIDQAFLAYLRQPAEKWDILEGALLIARQEYPDLDMKKITAGFDEMAGRVRSRIVKGMTKAESLERLNQFFFEEEGFTGNVENYEDPRNSYLPDVLERKLGIPISLSAVYLKMAWGSGIPLFGVNFPGHFLVAWKGSETAIEKNIYIDVFNGGKILGPEELGGLLAKRLGREANLEPATHLRNAGVREILHRMLANLKAIHASQDRISRAKWAAEWMILLKPQDLDSLRDKGMFCYALGYLAEAESALVEYLERTRKPPDLSQVWKVLLVIRAQDPIHLN